MRVLVTGATGFVGRVLCDRLAQSGYIVRAALRTDRVVPASVAEKSVTGDIGSGTQWVAALENVDLVVHAAGRTHVLNDSPDNADLYEEANSRATQRLAEASVQAGVRRFVFLSSIKVNGEESGERAHEAGDAPHPQDAYGRSKLSAESALWRRVAGSQTEAVIVRPPLVYGPDVRANFLRLLHWVDKGWWLPLGGVTNRRSLVSVWNLVDLVCGALVHPAAAGRVWLVSDGEDLSTPDLIRRLGQAMDRPVRLLSLPPAMLQLFGTMAGRKAEVARLCGSLSVDIGRTRADLAWSPPLSVDESLSRTVRWYLSRSPRA